MTLEGSERSQSTPDTTKRPSSNVDQWHRQMLMGGRPLTERPLTQEEIDDFNERLQIGRPGHQPISDSQGSQPIRQPDDSQFNPRVRRRPVGGHKDQPQRSQPVHQIQQVPGEAQAPENNHQALDQSLPLSSDQTREANDPSAGSTKRFFYKHFGGRTKELKKKETFTIDYDAAVAKLMSINEQTRQQATARANEQARQQASTSANNRDIQQPALVEPPEKLRSREITTRLKDVIKTLQRFEDKEKALEDAKNKFNNTCSEFDNAYRTWCQSRQESIRDQRAIKQQYIDNEHIVFFQQDLPTRLNQKRLELQAYFQQQENQRRQKFDQDYQRLWQSERSRIQQQINQQWPEDWNRIKASDPELIKLQQDIEQLSKELDSNQRIQEVSVHIERMRQKNASERAINDYYQAAQRNLADALHHSQDRDEKTRQLADARSQLASKEQQMYAHYSASYVEECRQNFPHQNEIAAMWEAEKRQRQTYDQRASSYIESETRRFQDELIDQHNSEIGEYNIRAQEHIYKQLEEIGEIWYKEQNRRNKFINEYEAQWQKILLDLSKGMESIKLLKDAEDRRETRKYNKFDKPQYKAEKGEKRMEIN